MHFKIFCHLQDFKNCLSRGTEQQLILYNLYIPVSQRAKPKNGHCSEKLTLKYIKIAEPKETLTHKKFDYRTSHSSLLWAWIVLPYLFKLFL